MRHSLTTKLIGFLFLYPLLINSALSKNINNQLLSNQLEEVLNERNDDLLKDLFLKQSLSKFNKHSLAFRKKYKDSKWSIKIIRNDPSKSLLDIKIKSKRSVSSSVKRLLRKS